MNEKRIPTIKLLLLKIITNTLQNVLLIDDKNTVEPLLTNTSLIRTVHLVPGKCPYILCKNNLYNTDPL